MFKNILPVLGLLLCLNNTNFAQEKRIESPMPINRRYVLVHPYPLIPPYPSRIPRYFGNYASYVQTPYLRIIRVISNGISLNIIETKMNLKKEKSVSLKNFLIQIFGAEVKTNVPVYYEKDGSQHYIVDADYLIELSSGSDKKYVVIETNKNDAKKANKRVKELNLDDFIIFYAPKRLSNKEKKKLREKFFKHGILPKKLVIKK